MQTKDGVLKDAYDEWLARIVCFAFSISPQALVSQLNRATAETAEIAAAEEGLAPLLGWVKGVIDRVLSEVLGCPDLEFVWAEARHVDALTQAKVDQIYLAAGVLSPNEVRATLGLAPRPAPPPQAPGAVAKGNPNHVSAGCPEGGRFCSADRAGDGGRTQVAQADTTASDAGFESGSGLDDQTHDHQQISLNEDTIKKIPAELKGKVKSMLSNVTNGSLSSYDIDVLYDSVVNSISIFGALRFQHVTETDEGVILNESQFETIEDLIDDVADSDLKEKARSGLTAALKAGRLKVSK